MPSGVSGFIHPIQITHEVVSEPMAIEPRRQSPGRETVRTVQIAPVIVVTASDRLPRTVAAESGQCDGLPQPIAISGLRDFIGRTGAERSPPRPALH